MRHNLHWLLSLGAALVWLSGCDDPLLPVERVEGLRVLGARVEVEDDAKRAAPAPGERATVRWLVAAPEGAPEVGFALALCVSEEKTFGSARCAGAPLAAAASAAPARSAPALAFEVPSALDVETTPRLAVLGSICEGALPLGEPEASRCPDGTPGTKVSLEFELARPGALNTNPSFADPAIEIDGTPWVSAPEASADCTSGELPSVSAGSGTHRLVVTLTSDARDALPKEHELDPEEESLLVSHFTSAGELERAFSSVSTDTPVEVSWTAPKSVAPAGELVRFWFVVRDLRGGSDFTERTLCVLP